ncbi:MAG: DNA polymerase III subunit beta [Dehalococcoidia bacterium]|nr:DNA polymerase III subunit beta [Dehalococcoidia bacterium]
MNIEGKRSGEGFVAHKAILVSALSKALAERLVLMDFTLGRKGLLGYLKALAGSNIIKIVPANGSASEVRASDKRLKVTCGSHTSYLEDLAWVGEKTPMTLCEVRVSPKRTVKPNIGGIELSEALNRVLPFTAKEDNRPVLQCVLFTAKEGSLKLVGADGYTLAVVKLDCDVEGQALIQRDDLQGIANALRKAHRVCLGFEASGDGSASSPQERLDSTYLVIDTEVTRYKWHGVDGTFPEYEKLIPTEAKTVAHLDTVEAIKAIGSLKWLTDNKAYPIDLHLNGGVVLSNPDNNGQVTIPADIEGGEMRRRLDGSYLVSALRACGGMVDFRLTDGSSPVVFTTEGYQLVVMPMITSQSQPKAQEVAEPIPEPEAVAEAETSSELAESRAEAVAEAEAIVKADKPKSHRKREPVAVA